MSVHVSSWVWRQKVGDLEAKIVLLKLADQSNDDGVCWPSRITIAESTETSVSTVSRSITYLVARGYITVEERRRQDGGQTSNLYRFPAFAADPPGPSDPPPGPSDPPPGSRGDPPPGSAVTRHEPSVEPSGEYVKPWEETPELLEENKRRLDELRKQVGL